MSSAEDKKQSPGGQSQAAPEGVSAQSGLGPSTGTFCELIAAGTPTPGGGSVAAYCGELAAALGRMMCNISIGKKKFEAVEPQLSELAAAFERLGARLSQLVAEDAASFEAVLAAYRLPKESEEEQAARDAAIAEAGRGAVFTPFETAQRAFEVLNLLKVAGEIGNQNAFSDITVGAQLANTAIRGAFYNVGVNLDMLKGSDEADRVRSRMLSMLSEAKSLAEEIESEMMKRM